MIQSLRDESHPAAGFRRGIPRPLPAMRFAAEGAAADRRMGRDHAGDEEVELAPVEREKEPRPSAPL